MPKLRTVIVDDEPLARERLLRLLSTEPQVEVVAECGDGLAAAEAIKRQAPDLMFLDIQMPGRDGLQVLAELPVAKRPAIIFVTAHAQFALDAFNVGAVDYLLKPFDRERFQVALARAEDFLKSRNAGVRPEGEAAPARSPDRLAIKTDGKVVFVRPEEIQWIEAADNYVVLHLGDRRLMARETLKSLELQLGQTDFARVNRSAFVRLDQVSELHPAAHGDYTVVLRNGTRLPLSRSLRGQLARFGAAG
jgi:two-component system LytT family response regulator